MDWFIMNTENRWLLCCLSLAAGEALMLSLGQVDGGGFAALASVIVAFLGYGFALRAWRYVAVALAGVALASFALSESGAAVRRATIDNSGRPYACSCRVLGDVRETVAKDGRGHVSFAAKMDSLRVKVIVPLSARAELPEIGDCWRCVGWLDRRKPEAGKLRRFWISGKGCSAELVSRKGLRSVLAGLRRELSRRLGYGLEHLGEIADLNRAILLGERSHIDRDLREKFVTAGTVHIFAISGLHVMLIVGILRFVLAAFCGVSLRYCALILIPVIWLYVMMTGESPSAIRAAAMASVHSLAPLFWRRSNGVVSWSVAFLVMHALVPELLADVGSELSFAVMLGIVVAARIARDRFGNRPVVSKLWMTLVAWVAGAPIAAHVFGRVSPGGLLANLVLIPAAAASVTASVMALVASVVSEAVAAYVNNLSALFTRAMVGVSEAVATLSWSSIEVGERPLAECLWFYVALALSLYLVNSLLARQLKRV